MYNKNLGVNFLKEYEFKLKFNRDPKEWTLKDIHDLYLRVEERSLKRRQEFSEFMNKIINEVEPMESGEIHVFFDRDGITCKYSIRKDDNFGWSYSTDRVTFSKDIVKCREEKIDFILNNKRKFELGEELRRLERMKSSFDRHVLNYIEQLSDLKLCEKYKNVKNFDVPKIIKVDIGGTVYYTGLDKESISSGYWKRFEILGKEQNKILKL